MNFNPLPRQQVHRSILLSNFTQSVRLKDSTENKLTFFLRLKFCVFSSIPREKYPLIHNISSPAFQTGILVITLFAPGVSWHGNGDDVIRRGGFLSPCHKVASGKMVMSKICYPEVYARSSSLACKLYYLLTCTLDNVEYIPC